MTLIKEFLSTASQEQKRVYERIVILAEKERKVCEIYNARQGEITRKVDQIKREYGFQTMLVDADTELFVDPLLPARDRSYKVLEKIRGKVAEQFRKAVDLDMSHLGFIQRNYQHYVGEPLSFAT